MTCSGFSCPENLAFFALFMQPKFPTECLPMQQRFSEQ